MSNCYQYNKQALETGRVTEEEAKNFCNFLQVRALETGKITPEGAQMFLETDEALELVSFLEKVSMDEGQRLEKPCQIEVLRVTRINSVADALRFKKWIQVDAFKTRKVSIEEALKFEDIYQVEALRVDGVSAEDALKIDNIYQVEALQAISDKEFFMKKSFCGKNSPLDNSICNLAHERGRVLKVATAGEALGFKNGWQLRSFKTGALLPEEAVKVDTKELYESMSGCLEKKKSEECLQDVLGIERKENFMSICNLSVGEKLCHDLSKIQTPNAMTIALTAGRGLGSKVLNCGVEGSSFEVSCVKGPEYKLKMKVVMPSIQSMREHCFDPALFEGNLCLERVNEESMTISVHVEDKCTDIAEVDVNGHIVFNSDVYTECESKGIPDYIRNALEEHGTCVSGECDGL